MRRLAAAVAMVLCASVTLGLAWWQVGRDGERNAGREAAMRVADAPVVEGIGAEWRRVRLTGEWDGVMLERGIFERDLPGFAVYSLLVAGEERVLVRRGWVPDPEVGGMVEGPVQIEGQRRPVEGRVRQPLGEIGGVRVWPGGAVPGMVAATGATAFVVAPDPAVAALPGGRASPVPLVPERDDTSRAYAVQWLAITGVIVGMWAYGWRRRFG